MRNPCWSPVLLPVFAVVSAGLSCRAIFAALLLVLPTACSFIAEPIWPNSVVKFPVRPSAAVHSDSQTVQQFQSPAPSHPISFLQILSTLHADPSSAPAKDTRPPFQADLYLDQIRIHLHRRGPVLSQATCLTCASIRSFHHLSYCSDEKKKGKKGSSVTRTSFDLDAHTRSLRFHPASPRTIPVFCAPCQGLVQQTRQGSLAVLAAPILVQLICCISSLSQLVLLCALRSNPLRYHRNITHGLESFVLRPYHHTGISASLICSALVRQTRGGRNGSRGTPEIIHGKPHVHLLAAYRNVAFCGSRISRSFIPIYGVWLPAIARQRSMY